MSGAVAMFSAPVVLRRAFFVAACLGVAAMAGAGPPASAPLPPLLQISSAGEARQALEQLRQQGIAGSYYLAFELRVMPRRGAERLMRGSLWGSRNASGPLTRVSIVPPPGGGAERRLLIQNGSHAAVWRWEEGRPVEMLGVTALFDPVVPGTELTAFDLEMPFIYWNDFVYEGLVRFLGRPAQVLLLRPPPEFAAKYPALQGVRVHLDTQFHALMQTELIGADGAVLKTVSLLDLKKVGEQWVPKTFDLRDEVSHDKTRFGVTAAALNLEFSPVLFEPARLSEAVRPPPPAELVDLGP